MAVFSKIVDGQTNSSAQVTNRNQLVVGQAAFSEASSVALITDDVPLNLWEPKSKHNFIITDIILRGDKNVSNTVDATVTIYESSVGPDSATQTKVVLSTVIPRSGVLVLNGLNLEVTEGRWVNAVTSDNNIYVTIMGYYIKVNS